MNRHLSKNGQNVKSYKIQRNAMFWNETEKINQRKTTLRGQQKIRSKEHNYLKVQFILTKY